MTTAFWWIPQKTQTCVLKPIFKNKTCSLADYRFKLKIKPWFMGTLILNSTCCLNKRSTCASTRASVDSGTPLLDDVGSPWEHAYPSPVEKSEPGHSQSLEEGPHGGWGLSCSSSRMERIQPHLQTFGGQRDRRKINKLQRRQPENRGFTRSETEEAYFSLKIRQLWNRKGNLSRSFNAPSLFKGKKNHFIHYFI